MVMQVQVLEEFRTVVLERDLPARIGCKAHDIVDLQARADAKV